MFSRHYTFIVYYSFEGYLSWYKIDNMVNNLRIAVNSSDFKKSVLIYTAKKACEYEIDFNCISARLQ